jgi:hypothetical protein
LYLMYSVGKTTKYRTVVVKKCQKLCFHARQQSSFSPPWLSTRQAFKELHHVHPRLSNLPF